MTGTPTKMTMGRSRIREKGPGLGGQCQMQHPQAVVGPGGALPVGSPCGTAMAATAWPPHAQPGSGLGFSGDATAPACCSPSVFNDDPRSYRFLHNPLLGPLPQRPLPHPRRSPSPCVSCPRASTGRLLAVLHVSVFNQSRSTAAVPHVQPPGFLLVLLLGFWLGGGLCLLPLAEHRLPGGWGLGLAEGQAGTWELPWSLLCTPPVEDTAAFSVLISVR